MSRHLSVSNERTIAQLKSYIYLFAETNEERIVEGTTDKERAKQLLTQDFSYVMTTTDGYMIFRKAK